MPGHREPSLTVEVVHERVDRIDHVILRTRPALLSGPDDQVVDTVDALMDDLYRQGRLAVPGHRWLSGPRPASIRYDLVRLYAGGNLHRDSATGEWIWSDLTSYVALPQSPVGPRVGHGGDRLFRQRRPRPA
jgi:hypothetical protein